MCRQSVDGHLKIHDVRDVLSPTLTTNHPEKTSLHCPAVAGS